MYTSYDHLHSNFANFTLTPRLLVYLVHPDAALPEMKEGIKLISLISFTFNEVVQISHPSIDIIAVNFVFVIIIANDQECVSFVNET